MMFEAEEVKRTAKEIEQIVRDGFSGDDISHSLNLVSRLHWQLGNLVSDIAEETLTHADLKVLEEVTRL
jgi:hypothetical protein